MNSKRWMLGFMAVFVGLAPVSAPSYAEYVMHARVSYDAGGTMVLGAEGGEWGQAPVNTLILPGDTLWVNSENVSEIELPGGAFLRMADASKVELLQLPPSTTFRGWKGSFYVQRLARSTGTFVFETPAASIEVDQDTTVRIDIEANGGTIVTTRWGRVTVRTPAGGATFVHEGRRLWVDPGMLPSMPSPFDRNASDVFDDWNRERAALLVASPEPLPSALHIEQIPLGINDLGHYGEWVYVDDTPYWRPTRVVDYVPYRYGHWSYTAGIGNVWVGRYPFSYVTSHHGHWNYDLNHGWLWSYYDQWSPAWAATLRYGDYYVWSPIDRHHRPVLGHYGGYYSLGGVQFSHFGSSYVHRDYLYGGPGHIFGTQHSGFHYDPQGDHGNVNIWNIGFNTGNSPVHTPFDPGTGRVRDYDPGRAIRGLSTAAYRDRAHSVNNLVSALERTVARSTFTTGVRSGSRGARTSLSSRSSANTRTLSLTSYTPSYIRATASAPERATEVRERLATRTSEGLRSPVAASSGTTSRGNYTVGAREAGESSGTVTTRGSGSVRPATGSTSGTATRGATSVSTVRTLAPATQRSPWRNSESSVTAPRTNPNLRIYTSAPPGRGDTLTTRTPSSTAAPTSRAPVTTAPSSSAGRTEPRGPRSVTSIRPQSSSSSTSIRRGGSSRTEPRSPRSVTISRPQSSSSRTSRGTASEPENSFAASRTAPRTSIRTVSSLRTAGGSPNVSSVSSTPRTSSSSSSRVVRLSPSTSRSSSLRSTTSRGYSAPSASSRSTVVSRSPSRSSTSSRSPIMSRPSTSSRSSSVSRPSTYSRSPIVSRPSASSSRSSSVGRSSSSRSSVSRPSTSSRSSSISSRGSSSRSSSVGRSSSSLSRSSSSRGRR